MRTLRLAAILVFALTSAIAGAQTTTTSATIVDSTGVTWAYANYTVSVVASAPPFTTPGHGYFQKTFTGNANILGQISLPLQSVAHIDPANSTWQFCITPSISATATYCTNIPVGNTGQSTEDVSAQITAVIVAPVITIGVGLLGYDDSEFPPVPGTSYYNVATNEFRCYTGSWGACGGGGGGGISSIAWSMPNILSASPNPLTGSGTETFSLVNQSANTVWAGPLSGGAAAPTFRALQFVDLPSIEGNTVLGETASGTPIAMALPSCSGATNALIWTLATGFGCNTISGGGSGIASITWALPSILSASPNPLTASGTETFSLSTQTANTFFAGPTVGSAAAPTFRAIGLTDLPTISGNNVLGETATGTPIALSLPSCSGATNALIWTSGSGFGCNAISAGSGTVTSIATTSPISGGTITGTGTLSCPTCVVASSPGAGIAHFAGGTQTVTSSLVLLTADVTGLLPLANIVPLPLSCQPGLGDGANAIPVGTYLTTTCKNETGLTWTLTAIRCITDIGSSTCNVTNGAGTALLTGAITGTSTYASGTQSGTTTIASGDYLKITYVVDGTTKQIGIDVAGTY